MRRRLTALGWLAMAALALAQEVPLNWTPKQGDTRTYALTMELSFFGDTASYSAKVHEKAVEVAPDKYVIETTQTEYKVSAFGEEGTVNDKDIPTARTVFAPNGDVLELRGSLANDQAYRMANLTAVRRPEKPVKVGDIWTREVKADQTTGVVSAKATYKVEQEAKINESDALECSFEYNELEGSDPARSTGKVWFAKANGAVLRVQATWTGAPIPGSPSPMTGTYKLEFEK